MALQPDSAPDEKEHTDIFEIEPTIGLPSEYSFAYLHTIQQVLRSMIPESLKRAPFQDGALFFRLSKMLPLAKYPEAMNHLHAIPIAFLCPSDYTPGVGRYIADSLSRWLIPGKQFPIVGRVSLNFRFVIHPSSRFYLTQEMIAIDDPSDIPLIQKNLPSLIEEMRVNIMAVYQARYITALRGSAAPHQKIIFKENLSSLLKPSDELNQSLFDQFQGVLTNITSEEKLDQIKKNLSHLTTSRPKTFDREIFYEIAQHSLLFRKQFSSKRDPRHLSRVIAYQHIFQKIALENLEQNPSKRHLSLKIIKGPLPQEKSSLAILFSFNFLRESESFELRHLMEALRACLPYLEYVPDSLTVDRRHEKIRFFYLEVLKRGDKPFSLQEIRHLKEKLPHEFMRQLETAVHPVFMPRNEEEVLRTLILLSNQIKYVRDLPQVSIHYDQQSDADLTFTVILVRLIKQKTLPVAQILEKLSPLKVKLDDTRSPGILKKKYKKEALILRFVLDKTPFFRADSSVDLLRARQKIVQELTSAFGEFRDFNGGIIVKQEEALNLLRKEFSPMTHEEELFLENYFYSLHPGIMQTVYETSILKEHFLLLKETQKPLEENAYQINKTHLGKYLLIFIQAMNPSFKEPLLDKVQALEISSHDLTTASLEVSQTSLLGFILRSDKEKNFLSVLEESMKTWEEQFLSPPL